MKKISLMLLIITLISCNKKKSSTSDSLTGDDIQGEWLTSCTEEDGHPIKYNFEIEGDTSSIRVITFDDADTECEGDGTGGDAAFTPISTIDMLEVGAPENIITYSDTIIDSDPVDTDYAVIIFENIDSIHLFPLGTGGTDPGNTWDEWLEYSSSGRDTSDFVDDPEGYANALHLTRVE
jgi:hypothetical protein